MQQARPRPNLDVFGDTLLALAREDRELLVVTSDSRGSGKLTPFGEALPDQIIETGIAEQNLVGVAAGLAAAGKRVFAVSPACFLTARALEQIKNDVCYSDLPVTLVGISAGVSYGALGSTHHSLHDYAVLRAIHNIAIVAPADNAEASAAVRAALAAPYPVYLRFGKRSVEHVHQRPLSFEIGRSVTVCDGDAVAFIACGETVQEAVGAAELLGSRGYPCRVVSMHTLKPLDTAAVLAAARQCRAVVTVEEHSVHGGLGEACARVLLEAGLSPRFATRGVIDEATPNGSQQELFRHYGLDAASLARTALELCGASGVTL
jgi:transketolase